MNIGRAGGRSDGAPALARVLAALRDDPDRPDLLAEATAALWSARGAGAASYPVDECPYSPEELSHLRLSGRRVSYLPPELDDDARRPTLGTIFPLMRSYAVEKGNPFTNDRTVSGWFDYDAGPDAAYVGTDETTLVERLRRDRRTLLSLNQYIVASQDHRAVHGSYLDERRTWARVGCRLDGRLVAVRFDGDRMAEGLGDEEPINGSLLVAYDVASGDCGSMLGARTMRGATPFGSRAAAEAAADDPLALAPAPADPAAEGRRIALAYVEHGFHQRLGMSAADYVRSLPVPGRQPAGYAGRLDMPLVVETRITWQEQASLLGVALSSGSARSEYVPADGGSPTPGRPYAGWFNRWGQRFADPVAAAAARAGLREDEVGAGPLELLAAHLAQPGLCRQGRFYEAVGHVARDMTVPGMTSAAERERTPCMYHWRGRPEIGAQLHPLAFSIFRPLLRGRGISRS